MFSTQLDERFCPHGVWSRWLCGHCPWVVGRGWIPAGSEGASGAAEASPRNTVNLRDSASVELSLLSLKRWATWWRWLCRDSLPDTAQAERGGWAAHVRVLLRLLLRVLDVCCFLWRRRLRLCDNMENKTCWRRQHISHVVKRCARWWKSNTMTREDAREAESLVFTSSSRAQMWFGFILAFDTFDNELFAHLRQTTADLLSITLPVNDNFWSLGP